jgi:hypothetical protein
MVVPVSSHGVDASGLRSAAGGSGKALPVLAAELPGVAGGVAASADAVLLRKQDPRVTNDTAWDCGLLLSQENMRMMDHARHLARLLQNG